MMAVRITDTVVSEAGSSYYEYEIEVEQSYNPDILEDLANRVVRMASIDRMVRAEDEELEPDEEDET